MKSHLIIIISEKYITFVRSSPSEGKQKYASGSESHDGTVVDCNRAINHVLKIQPTKTVEYIWSYELPA